MKIALCISGLCDNDESEKFVERHKSIFPYDTFTAAWKRDDLTMDVDYLFDEPTIDYHPVTDVPQLETTHTILRSRGVKKENDGEKWMDITKHWTKQILIHDSLLKKIPSDYDMIIRTRFDTIASKGIDFMEFIESSYYENYAIGFNTRYENVWLRHNELLEFVPHFNVCHVNDALILHPRNLWNSQLVETLHNSKELQAAETGWWQILSEPYGDNHQNFHGGVYIDKHKGNVLDVDEKFHNYFD
tara:strand:- start:23 stop:757 length:735 start_codon:yes stop_codon:yes gene_type:complete